MKEWLTFASEQTVIVIDALALVVIVIGTIEAFVSAMRAMFSSPTGHERRDVWLRFGRWLIAGLTFQLAADTIETSTTTSSQAVPRLGAIALIRTFLNYFLERDLSEARARQHEGTSNV